MERQPGRRGRPRKSPDTTPAAPAPKKQETTSESEALTPEKIAEQIRREQLPFRVLHQFTKLMYGEWDRAKLMQGVLQAQNEMFNVLSPVDCFQTLVTLTGIAIEEAEDKQDDVVSQDMMLSHEGYKAALGHFNRSDRVETGKPTDTSKLPPMTGSKG